MLKEVKINDFVGSTRERKRILILTLKEFRRSVFK